MKLFACYCAVFIATISHSQDYEKVITSGVFANAITHDNTNGVVVAGGTESGSDFYLAKIDSVGGFEWQQVISFDIDNSFTSPQVFEIIPTLDSSFLITGAVENSAENASNAFLLKVDINGNELWHHYFSNGSGTECSHSAVLETLDSNYILTWGDINNGMGMSHIVINNVGNILSNELWEWGSPIEPVDMETRTDSSYLIAGNLMYSSSSSRAAFLSEVDTSGTTLWTKVYPDQYFHDLLVEDSFLYMASVHVDDGNQYLLTKLDTAGFIYSTDNPIGQIAFDLENHTQLASDSDSTLLFYTSEYTDSGVAARIHKNGTTLQSFLTVMRGADIMATGNGGALFAGKGPHFGVKCVWVDEIGLIQKDSILSESDCFIEQGFSQVQLSAPASVDTSFGTAAPCTISSGFVTQNDPLLTIEERCVYYLGNLQELRVNFMHVYPTISDGIFHFTSLVNDPIEVAIYASDGRIIATLEDIRGESSIDLSSYSDGIYYFSARTANKLSTRGSITLVK
ncbi:MAG: T9SS type A sorting domain-containing protein [Fluviicola sp.]